ncbi:MAG: type II toxin-antitoxin system HicA family toxin, partial [Terracidiphilus sp.]
MNDLEAAAGKAELTGQVRSFMTWLGAGERAGFAVTRVSGSHHVMRHADGRTVIVPVHAGKDMAKGNPAQHPVDRWHDRRRVAEAAVTRARLGGELLGVTERGQARLAAR